MSNYFQHIKVLLKRLLIVLVLYVATRLYFYVLNYNFFSAVQFFPLMKMFFYGIRFDISAIAYTNVLIIILHVIPGNFKNHKIYQLLKKILFVAVNSIMLATNFIDSKFFEFEEKRLTSDIFSPVWLGKDTVELMPQFIHDYWYIIISWFIVIFILIYFYPKLKQRAEVEMIKGKQKIKQLIYQSALCVFLLAFSVLCARGGFQLKPLRIITAAKYANSNNVSLVLNSPFTLLKTVGKKEIKIENYFTKQELNEIFNPVRQYESNSSFRKMNVVVFILESFGKEYIGSLNNNKGYTPFLDSLISRSLVFDYAFANGKKSIEAVPSVLASIPALMNNPFITSNYSSNKINSLASILNKEGYYSSFFHGGNNGTMGFDNFTMMADIDDYYGRNEYDKQGDYDGNWGIFDEPYLQYYAQKLSEFNKPFFSCLFTLSSHHPYTIPKKYEGKFRKGELINEQSISYADYSLKQFFKTASKLPWYKNTLFVFTADHTAQAYNKFYKNKLGRYSIPIIYFCPGDTSLKGINHTITQQADIMPSVLDYLNYNKKFIAYGNSVFDTTADHYAVNYMNGIYQFINNGYTLLYDGNNVIGLYNIRKDRLLKHNLLKKLPQIVTSLENKLKAILQSYNNRLINNELIIRDKN
ncbi:MAG: sulfatase-like hydrolase/transferase [Bacteroidales bacterium]|nr:sulfatase-like hydrolase/transferase [Bacteroidales bacterium]